MEWHPYAKLFPMLGDDELHALAEDIRVNGLKVPITIDAKDRIIDGRNREEACVIAGVTPVYEPFVGTDAEVLKLVISLNVHRRHLTESQRAMVAAEVANLGDGQRRPSKKGGSIDLPLSAGVSIPEAAEALNVSEPSVKRARKVKERGVPELAEAVVAGDIAVSNAAKIADMPAEKQREIVQEVADPKPKPKAKLEAKPYDVMEDVIRLTALRDKLAPNWNTAEDCGIIRQLFHRFSKEV